LIFKRIELTNLFTYRNADINLDRHDDKRNIVLIQGKNGFGKTSFINSIKLLFVGPNEDMCRSVQLGRKLTPKQYVLGLGEDWMGILNYRAKKQGENTCSVRIIWHEGEVEVETVRKWVFKDSNYNEFLTVDVYEENPSHLENEEAQQFLSKRLPDDFLPFFFFDGEQIQNLAEANRSDQQKQIERLLNISPVDTLTEYMDKLSRRWRNQSMEAEERAKLIQLENEVSQLDAQNNAETEREKDLDREREELEIKIQEEDQYLEGRRIANLAHEERHLTSKRKTLSDGLEKAQLELIQFLPDFAPLIVNPDLVKRALEEARGLVENDTAVQADALNSVLGNLPDELFAKPPFSSPPLTQKQVDFYKQRLEKWLDAYIPGPDGISDGLFRIEQGRARSLLYLLDRFSAAGKERRQCTRQLRSITRTKIELLKVDKRLDDLSNLSPDEQAEYAERKSANDQNKVRLGKIESELHNLRRRQNEIKDMKEKKFRDIKAQEKRVHLSELSRRRLDCTQYTKEFFNNYKNRLKERKREGIEEAINQRFKELTLNLGIVASIEVDKQFGLHFKDRDKNPIAMGSLSAGIKQLLATSLLWALKDESNTDLPLVIDTPLARIDRENQERLLRNYYPAVGSQVIVLPTDSELDREKHKIIAPHVYREYRLENPKGDDARLVETQLYGDGEEVAVNG
jgi:DNA sulfur modification protein DndD